jgi:uncharacterized DUF497 family protein|tara:strand:- start:33533 stop:33787 length:255 start_codon:yes stop_codon:yes gene_type:complete
VPTDKNINLIINLNEMKTVYSDHALKRMKQRGITELEIQHVLSHPSYVKKSFEGRKEAVGNIQNRTIKVVFFETENYIKVVTLI